MPSRDPQIRAIEVEAARLANADGKTSHAERYRIRQQLRSQQGLGKEGIKRGGISGVWDRNKGAIGSIAGGLAASFIPGAGAFLLPALGGALGGAAARGRLDADNLLGDSLGGMGGAGIKSLASSFIPKAAGLPGLPAPGAATNNVMAGLRPPVSAAAAGGPAVPMGGSFAGVAASGGASQVPGRIGGMLAGAANYAKANPEVVAMGLQGAGQAMQANANRAMADRRMDLEERAYADEQARRKRIAELLAPTWQRLQNPTPPAMPGLPALPMGGR